MKSVLLTGVCGYIGSVLCHELLQRGYDVVGIDNCRYNNGHALLGLMKHNNFKFHPWDVRWAPDEYFKIAQSVDVVIPLAGLVGAPICDRHESEATAVNLQSAAVLADHLTSNQRVIYPNTNSGYGQTDGSSFCTEEDELKPISRYARDKCEAESHFLRSAAKSTVFRLATVFGASPRMRMDLMVNDFTRRLTYMKLRGFRKLQPGGFNGKQFEVFDPHYKRNFVHVMDVARAFIYAIENDLDGVYNLGLPTANLTKLELAHTVCDQIGLSREAVIVGNGIDPDKRNYIVSNDKILSTGFRFENDLARGIAEVNTLCVCINESRTREMSNV